MLLVQADADRWDTRYQDRRTGDPSPPKGFDSVELAQSGRWLDVACGLGEQAIWAALRGYEVVALDASPVAIQRLRDAASEHGVADGIDAQVCDLDNGLPGDVGGFDVVLCQRFRGNRIYPELVRAALPGGVIIVTVLSHVGRGHVEIGPFHATPGELVDAFRDLDVEIAVNHESEGEATLIARRR